MSKLRDKVRVDIAYQIGRCLEDPNLLHDCITEILSIPELAKGLALYEGLTDTEDELNNAVKLVLGKANGKKYHLAVVDLEAKLPREYGRTCYETLKAVLEDHKIDLGLLSGVVGETQMDMFKAGWVKEVKDG